MRARRREWLESFRAYCPEMGRTINSGGKADYQWRAWATPQDVARAVARAVLAIDYSNFKNATMGQAHGLADPKLRFGLHDAYYQVWDVMLKVGDGTSVYQLSVCQRLGHWWPKGATRCKDCGARKPAAKKRPPAKRGNRAEPTAVQPALTGEGVSK